MCVHVHECVATQLYVKVRGQCPVSPSIAFHFIFNFLTFTYLRGVGLHVCHGMCVNVRGQRAGVRSLLLPGGFWRSNSDGQVWQQPFTCWAVASPHPCVFEPGSLTSPTQWSPESWGYRQLSFYMGAGVKPSAEQALHQLSQLHSKFYLTNWQCFRLLLFYSCSLELKHINTFFLCNNKSLTMAPVNEVTVQWAKALPMKTWF